MTSVMRFLGPQVTFQRGSWTTENILLKNISPAYTSEIYHPTEQMQKSRSSKHSLHLPYRTSNQGQRGLSFMGPKIWNKLPSDIKTAGSVNTFKHGIKKTFFDDLKRKEDDIYIYY